MQCPMELAVRTAKESKHPLFKLGAVLDVDGRKMICKSNLPAFLGCPGVCAETRLLRNLPRFAKRGGVLYVARIQKVQGNLVMARPCTSCQKWIKSRGIHEIWYTNEAGIWVREYMN